MTYICSGDNYETECLIYLDAVQWREEKKIKSLKEHCPFAQNTVCDKPWLWVCKGSTEAWFLTEVEENQHGLPIRDSDGNVVFKPGRSISDIKEACLSGDAEIYEECPHYKEGVEFREYVKRVKKGEKP
jgi:hypothetical protein